jgi:hypothetical protein
MTPIQQLILLYGTPLAICVALLFYVLVRR